MLILTKENFGEYYRRLRAPFPAAQVGYRILSNPRDDKTPNGRGKFEGHFVAPIAFYVDARAVFDRLNFTIGPQNWQLRHPMGLQPEGIIAELSIKIDGEWITKSDGSEYTAIEGTKGGISKSIVRAAVPWGIGSYLYDVKSVYHPVKPYGKSWGIDYNHGISGVPREPELPKEFLPQ